MSASSHNVTGCEKPYIPVLQTPAQQAWGPEWGRVTGDPQDRHPNMPFPDATVLQNSLLTPKALFKRIEGVMNITQPVKTGIKLLPFFIDMEGPETVVKVRKTNALLHVHRI